MRLSLDCNASFNQFTGGHLGHYRDLHQIPMVQVICASANFPSLLGIATDTPALFATAPTRIVWMPFLGFWKNCLENSWVNTPRMDASNQVQPKKVTDNVNERPSDMRNTKRALSHNGHSLKRIQIRICYHLSAFITSSAGTHSAPPPPSVMANSSGRARSQPLNAV